MKRITWLELMLLLYESLLENYKAKDLKWVADCKSLEELCSKMDQLGFERDKALEYVLGLVVEVPVSETPPRICTNPKCEAKGLLLMNNEGCQCGRYQPS